MAERRTVDLPRTVPSTLVTTNRTARPIVALARLPWAQGIWVAFMPIAVRRTMTTMNGALPRTGAAAVQIKALVAHGAQDGHHHWQIHGQASRHVGVDGDFLGCDGPLPHRFRSPQVSGDRSAARRHARTLSSVGATIGKPSVQPRC